MSEVIFDKAWLAGCVFIVVGIVGIYALFNYPKTVLTTVLIGLAGLTALVLVLAGMQEWKYMKIREDNLINESIETGKLANYLSNNPEYMRDEFIVQWLRDWQYSY